MIDLYVDSADRARAEPLLQSGCFRGLTTNPTLLRDAGVRRGDLGALVDWALAAGAQVVFLQTWGSTVAELSDHAHELRDLDPRVVVKVPVTPAGVAVAAALEAAGTPTLVTAVYSGSQVLPTLAARASYVAPYLGRMADAGRDAREEVSLMQRAIAATGSTTRLLVASIREPRDVVELAASGVSDFTIGPALWARSFSDPATAAALEVFEQAAALL